MRYEQLLANGRYRYRTDDAYRKRAAARVKKRRKTKRAEVNAASRKWKAANPDKCRVYDRKQALRRYKLTPEAYARMLEAQGGVCAVCHRPETQLRVNGDVKRLAVDHDHETGKVRGLLCHKCNRALGLLCDNPKIINSLSAYAAQHQPVACRRRIQTAGT